MVKIENERKNRIPFSQRLFWSVFFMFLGFTACFLLFQYQREKEFAQEKLNNVLSNYNYQLFRKCQHRANISRERFAQIKAELEKRRAEKAQLAVETAEEAEGSAAMQSTEEEGISDISVSDKENEDRNDK